MHFDLVDLRLFVMVLDTGGIAAAARKAHLSVSALSERMKGLEDRAGVKLLLRDARGSRPTPTGLQLANQARSVLMQAERLQGMVTAWQQTERGFVRMMANSNAIMSFLPEILASFLARHPEVSVDLSEASSDEIARAIRVGEADVGIAASNADLRDLDTQPFCTDRLALLVYGGHPLAQRASISFAEVLDEHFIGLDTHAAIQVYVDEHARRLGHTLTTRIRMRSFDGVCRMVTAGAGIAIVPVSAVPTASLMAGAVVIPLSEPWSERELMICLPRDREVTAVVRMLASDISDPFAGRLGQGRSRGGWTS